MNFVQIQKSTITSYNLIQLGFNRRFVISICPNSLIKRYHGTKGVKEAVTKAAQNNHSLRPSASYIRSSASNISTNSTSLEGRPSSESTIPTSSGVEHTSSIPSLVKGNNPSLSQQALNTNMPAGHHGIFGGLIHAWKGTSVNKTESNIPNFIKRDLSFSIWNNVVVDMSEKGTTKLPIKPVIGINGVGESDNHGVGVAQTCSHPACGITNCGDIKKPCLKAPTTSLGNDLTTEACFNLTSQIPEGYDGVLLDNKSNASGSPKKQEAVIEQGIPFKNEQIINKGVRLGAQSRWVQEDATHDLLANSLPQESIAYKKRNQALNEHHDITN